MQIALENASENIVTQRRQATAELSSKAMRADPLIQGGIDIKNINVARTGIGEAIRFDETSVRRLVTDGFDGLTPVFLGLTLLDNPLMAIGVK